MEVWLEGHFRGLLLAIPEAQISLALFPALLVEVDARKMCGKGTAGPDPPLEVWRQLCSPADPDAKVTSGILGS